MILVAVVSVMAFAGCGTFDGNYTLADDEQKAAVLEKFDALEEEQLKAVEDGLFFTFGWEAKIEFIMSYTMREENEQSGSTNVSGDMKAKISAAFDNSDKRTPLLYVKYEISSVEKGVKTSINATCYYDIAKSTMYTDYDYRSGDTILKTKTKAQTDILSANDLYAEILGVSLGPDFSMLAKRPDAKIYVDGENKIKLELVPEEEDDLTTTIWMVLSGDGTYSEKLQLNGLIRVTGANFDINLVCEQVPSQKKLSLPADLDAYDDGLPSFNYFG